MVAIYTSAYPDDQEQSLAYSTDRGRTWTKYAGNPVLDDPDREFRDPKVFWYEPADEWRMVVVKAVQRKVAIYRSDDLKEWEHLSDFGPANAVGGIWECPDLFPLPVDGKRKQQKWVMIVSLNPGAIAGGSGTQYFVGDFDGTTFTADNVQAYTPPAGEVFEDFEGADYGDWTTTGTAFGSGPATGTLPGQQTVSGFEGDRLVNSFLDFDSSQGTLTSPPFQISRDYINLLVGGGAHAHDPAAGDGTPPPGERARRLREHLRGRGLDADRRLRRHAAASVAARDGWASRASTRSSEPRQQRRPAHGQDRLAGVHDHPRLRQLHGRGRTPHGRAAHRRSTSSSTDEVVRTAAGHETGNLNWVAWNVKDLVGKRRTIEIVDLNTGGWGHILADHFMVADAPAKIRSDETAVNLLVDGEVVRSTAGKESEALDWVAWNVADLDRPGRPDPDRRPQQRRLGPHPRRPDHVRRRRRTIDRAALQLAGLRQGLLRRGLLERRPRRPPFDDRLDEQLAVRQPDPDVTVAQRDERAARDRPARPIDGHVRLVQQPVRELRPLRTRARLPPRAQAASRRARTRLTGRERAARRWKSGPSSTPATADRLGLKVRAGDGEETVIGYDAETEELYVDRTRSGDVGFSRDFPGVQRAPLAARGTDDVRLRILVDWSSVEVFADRGQRDHHRPGVPATLERASAAVRRRRERGGRVPRDPATPLGLVSPRQLSPASGGRAPRGRRTSRLDCLRARRRLRRDPRRRGVISHRRSRRSTPPRVQASRRSATPNRIRSSSRSR